jgi:hypothetical protein
MHAVKNAKKGWKKYRSPLQYGVSGRLCMGKRKYYLKLTYRSVRECKNQRLKCKIAVSGFARDYF